MCVKPFYIGIINVDNIVGVCVCESVCCVCVCGSGGIIIHIHIPRNICTKVIEMGVCLPKKKHWPNRILVSCSRVSRVIT